MRPPAIDPAAGRAPAGREPDEQPGPALLGTRPQRADEPVVGRRHHQVARADPVHHVVDDFERTLGDLQVEVQAGPPGDEVEHRVERGGVVARGVVRDDQPAVPVPAQVDLHEVAAEVDRRLDRLQRVLDAVVPGTAAVRRDEDGHLVSLPFWRLTQVPAVAVRYPARSRARR
ncbi:hypothetical protein FHP06_15145 [Aeromicrobium terrae]|uniref:Uncharacterized protein n=1 Tax=Aeromicrobium terrae TaxID=2498846 RepID=A0A5C8NEI6_9ACTN|nr:hypothetical protein FHP06_15145 [Aeromicrobium terrae]